MSEHADFRTHRPHWTLWRVLLYCLALFGLITIGTPLVESVRGDKLVVLTVRGALRDPAPLAKEIERLRRTPTVKAVVLRIDSPGGDVAAAQELYAGLKRLREQRQIPVIAAIGSMAASGGYYVALAADKIVANPGSLTGSIGVIYERVNLQDLAERFGVRHLVVKRGDYKDLGSPWRTMTDVEKSMLQRVLDDIYGQFVQTVSEARHLPLATVQGLADGRVWTGQQAIELGLIDTIGTFQEAVSLAATLAHLPENPRVVEWEPPTPLLERVGQLMGGVGLWQVRADGRPVARWDGGIVR